MFAAIAGCAIVGFADFLFRGQLIAFVGDGHGTDNFGVRMVGFAIDILRGDLEGVEEQAGAARIEAGAEQPDTIWEIATWMEAESSSKGSLMSSQLELSLGHGMHAGVEITVSRLAQSRDLASFSVGFDVTT